MEEKKDIANKTAFGLLLLRFGNYSCCLEAKFWHCELTILLCINNDNFEVFRVATSKSAVSPIILNCSDCFQVIFLLTMLQ